MDEGLGIVFPKSTIADAGRCAKNGIAAALEGRFNGVILDINQECIDSFGLVIR